MNGSNLRPVYIIDSAVLNAAGCEGRDLYAAAPQPQPLAFDPERLGFCIDQPRLPPDVFDRKIQRSVEAQSARLLYCAARLAPSLRALNLCAERIALTAAIPEVDAPSPGWAAVEAIQREPSKLLAHLFANTPPLQALTLLNSSAMAHVAEGLQCKGPMGGYCAPENAGFDALIEAVNQIAENRADAAVVVSGSPNITPALYLREELTGRADAGIRGEGAAALLLAAAPQQVAGLTVRIAGYARGYCPAGRDAGRVMEGVLQRALAAEKLSLSDVGLVFGDAQDLLLVRLLSRSGALLGTRPVTGYLGASALLTDIAYALHHHHPCPRYVLLASRTHAAHCAALLLSIDVNGDGL